MLKYNICSSTTLVENVVNLKCAPVLVQQHCRTRVRGSAVITVMIGCLGGGEGYLSSLALQNVSIQNALNGLSPLV